VLKYKTKLKRLLITGKGIKQGEILYVCLDGSWEILSDEEATIIHRQHCSLVYLMETLSQDIPKGLLTIEEELLELQENMDGIREFMKIVGLEYTGIQY